MIAARMNYTVTNLQLAFKTHTTKVFPVRGRILLFLGLLLVWTGLILWLINITQAVKPAYVFYIIAGIIFIIVHYFTMHNLGKQAFRKLKDRSDIQYQFTFNNEGFNIQAQQSGQKYLWSQVDKALLSEKILMIYVSKQTFYFLLPEHITQGSFTDLCELVQNNVRKVLK